MSTADSETEQQQQPALRVQDALGYLDQVKSKFNDQPYVYNQFLDIMKEFKSQALDTPGVIDKVSLLFRGHTDLIIGFNTFLPPGYRIEQMPHNEIRITTLQGPQQNQTTTFALTQQPRPPTPPTQQQPPLPQPQTTPTPPSQQQPPLPQPQTAPTPPSQQQQPPLPQPQTTPTPPSQQQPLQPQPQTTPTPTPPTQQQPLQPHQQTTPINLIKVPKQLVQQPPTAIQPGSEFGFNHALNYVNKIKHRFSANPEIYQQFLEILHKYQRDQHATKVPRSKMLLESEVYNHVARLFQNQRDLLEEFSQFLPDANGSGTTGGNINSLTRVHHQLSPNASVNSNPPNFGLRLVNDNSIVINNEMVPLKRQNARGGNNHHNRMSMKRQNNSLGNMTYNSTKVSCPHKLLHLSNIALILTFTLL